MKFLVYSFLCLAALNCVSQTYSGLRLDYMDRTIAPGEDFYAYCNGTWEKQFQLPLSDARYGTFNEIHNRNLQKIHALLEAYAKNRDAAPGSDVQRLRDFYLSGMDSASLDSKGTEVLIPLIRRIDTLEGPEELMALKSEFDQLGIDLFFKVKVAPDLRNSKKNVLYFTQGGYGMGDRDDYHHPSNTSLSEAYMDYLQYLFTMNGYSAAEAESAAEEIYFYEKALCNDALSREELREREKGYHPADQGLLKTVMPSVNWTSYFSAQGLSVPDTVILSSLPYFERVNKLLQMTPVPVLRLYIKAQLFQSSAPYLSTKIQFTDFQFREKVMRGSKAIKPRWERVCMAMDLCLGEMLSKDYVKHYFPAESKMKVNKMVDQLLETCRERLRTRNWLSAEARAMSEKKLSNMIRKIAYPEHWKSYKGLVIKKQSYWENVCQAKRFDYREMLKELKQPVNRMKWQMTPLTVNAYYDPCTNEITLPAGLLQPPFFDAKADDAANFGTMGALIAHELTHAFDDQGSKFDASGNYKPWWTENDLKNFNAASERLAEQYKRCLLPDSTTVNGKMTLGENMADLGGVTLAFYTYKKTLNGSRSPVLEGFTGEQRFFIAWAQGWKSKVREEEMKRLLRQDFHAPARIRAVVPLTHLAAFYEAFEIKPGEKLYRPENERVDIW